MYEKLETCPRCDADTKRGWNYDMQVCAAQPCVTQDRLNRFVADWKCPNCKAFADFTCGPKALNTSVNITCNACGSRYNVTPLLGAVQSIDAPPVVGTG